MQSPIIIQAKVSKCPNNWDHFRDAPQTCNQKPRTEKFRINVVEKMSNRPASGHSSLHLPLSWQSGCSPCCSVSFGQPSAGFDQLNDIDTLLHCHNRETNASNNPRYKRVHLIRSRQFQCSRTVGIEEKWRFRLSRASRLERCPCGSIVRDL